jgi:hypothetical protein
MTGVGQLRARRDDRERPHPPRTGAIGTWVLYAVAVLGFVGIAMVTKKYLTWSYGPIYFVVVLEVLPRLVRRIRRGWPRPTGPVPDDVPDR